MTKALKFKDVVLPILIFWLVMTAISFIASSNAKSADMLDTDISEGEFKMAKVIFPISNVSQNGNNVSLTIDRDARKLEAETENHVYSAMQRTGSQSSKCPLVNSTAIDKNIKSYNPFTGRADLDVTFKTAEQAKKAAAADCLLIKDTEID